jgi:predicted  nucleic acid-binding Zn-ribbon protein
MSVREDPAAPLRNLSALEEAEERAFRRGQESAALKAKVESHEKRLNALNGSIDRSTAALRQLEKTVDKIGEQVRGSAAVTATRAEDAKAAAEKGLSTRTFVFSLLAAATGVCLVVIGALALFVH